MTHHHHRHDVGRKLTIAACLNVLVVAGELSIGWWAGSLALIGDALHNGTDVVALLLALVAVRLERKPATTEMSFGYQRAGVLVAFINAATLVALTVFFLQEAWSRLGHPHAVQTSAMLITAIVALAVNTGTAWSLYRESHGDVNVKGAVIHMIGDAISSAGIIVAALLIRFTGSTIWDAVVSMLIGTLILWSSYGVLKESVNLLLEGTPSGIDPGVVQDAIGAIDGVQGVHHLHIWALGPSSPALSCHLMVGDVPVKHTAALLDEINALLLRDFRIAHTTIQFEFTVCAVDDPSCTPYPVGGVTSGKRT